ncbi:MAG: PhzF family phenazine biosynthesis protein [Thermoanaerobacteraceae bacterium]|nr:PhzF family phenazine biosynthesis protein [Thermoanaerobacteraceae bacterium]
MRFFWVDAFTREAFGGNPAGVVIGEPNEDMMQGLAKELKISEVAFINLKNGISIRYFTPERELDLCGHATIASFYTLASKGYLDLKDGVNEFDFNTKAGDLKAYINIKGGTVENVFMTQSQPRFGDKIPKGKVAYYLGISENDIVGEPMAVSTGVYDIIVGVSNKRILNGIKADRNSIIAFTEEFGAESLHLFTFDTYIKDDLVLTRNMAPALGIDEEAATGTANGALGVYLLDSGLLSENPLKFNVEQGITMGRPSLISVEISKNDKYEMKVGGAARIIIEGEFCA